MFIRKLFKFFLPLPKLPNIPNVTVTLVTDSNKTYKKNFYLKQGMDIPDMFWNITNCCKITGFQLYDGRIGLIKNIPFYTCYNTMNGDVFSILGEYVPELRYNNNV